jgi:hypothetical protein
VRNGSAANYSSWVSVSANAQSRRTCDTCAHPDQEGKVGRPSCAIMPGRSREPGACDFLHITDLCFRSLFVFFIIELQTRKVIYVGVTRSPTDAWTARTSAGGNSLWADAEVSHS